MNNFNIGAIQTGGVSYTNLPIIGALGSVVCLGLVLATFLQERRVRRIANDNAPLVAATPAVKAAAE